MTSRVLGAFTATVTLVLMGASVGAAQAQAVEGDRYGPEPASQTDMAPQGPTAHLAAIQAGPDREAQMRTGMLSWPGKIATLGPAMASSAGPSSAPPAFRRAQTASVRASRPRQNTPDRRRTAADERSPASFVPTRTPSAPGSFASDAPHYGLVRAAPSGPVGPVLAGAPVRPLPQSIYDRSAGAAAPVAPAAAVQTASAVQPLHPGWAPPRRPWVGAYGDNVRLYSVHRSYGLKPDPAPIPPQFFAATADVSAPAGPIAERRTVSGSGTAAQAARAVQTSDVDASSAQP